jgi:hypothetical protein
MLRVLLAISTIIATGLALILAVVLQDPQVSTIEIDRDRTALAAEISTTQAESEKYAPSLLKSLIEVRLAITQNTLAMLDQKRASVIRRIALNYRIDTQPVREASDQELNIILEDLSQAEKKAAASKLARLHQKRGRLDGKLPVFPAVSMEKSLPGAGCLVQRSPIPSWNLFAACGLVPCIRDRTFSARRREMA